MLHNKKIKVHVTRTSLLICLYMVEYRNRCIVIALVFYIYIDKI